MTTVVTLHRMAVQSVLAYRPLIAWKRLQVGWSKSLVTHYFECQGEQIIERAAVRFGLRINLRRGFGWAWYYERGGTFERIKKATTELAVAE